MAGAFKIKIDTVDTVNKSYEDLINSTFDKIKISDAAANGQTYTDSTGNQITTTVDANDTVHITSVQSGASATVSGDSTLHSHTDFKGIANGVTTYEEVTDVQSDRTTTSSVSGSGLVDHMDHASVTVAAHGNATLLGPGVNITAGAGASVTAGGNGQSASDHDLGTVNANGGTVTLADNSRENVYETGGSIISGNHVNFGAIGSGMNVTCPSTSNLWVGDDGRANPVLNVVHASDSNVTVLDNSWVNVYDTGGVITGGMHDSFGALGTNITINCPVNSSSGVWIGAAGTSSSVSDKFVGQGIGSGSNITLMNDISNTALSVQGTGVTMYGLTGGDKVTISGTQGIGDILNSSNDTTGSGGGITLSDNSQASVAGSGNVINLGASASLNANGGTNNIFFNSNDHIGISGTAGIGSDILIGNNTAGGTASNGESAGIFFGSNTQANISGANNYLNINTSSTTPDTVNILSTGSGKDYLSGSNATIDTYRALLDATGSNDQFSGQAGFDTFNIQGTYDPFNDTSATINYYGGSFQGDTLSAPASWGDFLNFYSTPLSDGVLLASKTSGSGSGVSNSDITTSGQREVIVFNLAGAPVSTVSMSSSGVELALDDVGTHARSGWITAGESLLCFAPQSGKMEVSDLVAGLSSLAGYDSNADGKIDKKDPIWDQLRIWTDNSGKGLISSGGLKTLDQAGISSIALIGKNVIASSNGNTILDQSTASTTHGSSVQIANVNLAYQIEVGSGSNSRADVMVPNAESYSSSASHHAPVEMIGLHLEAA